MTKGVLLFASSNKEINYVALAELCAKRCARYLGLPVTLITTTPEDIKDTTVFDQVIIQELSLVNQYRKFKNGEDSFRVGTWKNFSRADAWSLTPYDETLVIDVDYFLFTDKLSWVFEQSADLVISKGSVDLSFYREQAEFQYLGNTKIDFYWATVFFFRKTEETRIFFDLILHIQDNWLFYKQQYQFVSSLFRNDYAFSIAAHILKDLVTDLPFKLHFITDQDIVLDLNDTACKVLTKSKNSYLVSDIRDVDIHVMNKLALQEIYK